MLTYARGTASILNRTLLLVALVLGVSAMASAQVPLQYTFSHTVGEATDMSEATLLLGDLAGNDDVVTGVQPIGFPFVFQGVVYTNYSANSNGLIKLGDVPINGQFSNRFSFAAPNYPMIANFWEDLYLDTDPTGSDGGEAGIRALVDGVPGRRVLTLEWKARRFGGTAGPGEIPYFFQTRLYEGTNVIEFYYEQMSTNYSTSGSIGLGLDAATFMSVTPGWGIPLSAPTVSTTTPNDTIQLQDLGGGDEGEGDDEPFVELVPVERLPSGTLYVFSPIVMGSFTSNSSPVGPGSTLFALMASCIGNTALSVPVTVTNTGLFDFNIDAFDLFQIDSTDTQGAMNLRRDAFGRPIATSDYVVTDAPGTAPLQSNVSSTFPDTVRAGESRTYYVTFVGQQPGRRLARAFVRTNGSTFSSTDTNAAPPTLTQGLLAVDLIGEGVGARLARNLAGDRPSTLVFPDTRAGDTTIRTISIVNSGACALRINRRRLRIFSGDVNEYKLVSVFPGVAVDNVADDYIIDVGDSGLITVAFMPVRSGTRLATIFMQSNDSTLGIPGITERGSFYLDLHGRGRAGLDARDLVLRPVVIGSFSNGVVVVENTSITTVDIARIYFEGLDSAEFIEDGSNAWPTLPSRIVPGKVLRLGVRLTPAAGSTAGIRRTTMVVVTTTGDTLRIRIRGEAGTQQLLVSPTILFENVAIPVGSAVRQTVRISNTGTLPVRLTTIVITGVDMGNYVLGLLPRRDLDPGQSEFLEVTFAPTSVGTSDAQLEISSNSGPTQIVALGGASLRAHRDPADDATTVAPNPGPASRMIETGRPTLK
ncbi:MAG: choice-of-anchor D domain-containing protein [bacterium]|nr:choice-of-anchor D domain-containing protein [Candidatus Kapabacteria bacterium]